MCLNVPCEEANNLTQEGEPVTKQHGRPKVVDQVQIREGAPGTVVLQESVTHTHNAHGDKGVPPTYTMLCIQWKKLEGLHSETQTYPCASSSHYKETFLACKTCR